MNYHLRLPMWMVLFAACPALAQPLVSLASPTNQARFANAVGMELNIPVRASVVNPGPGPSYSFNFFADGILIASRSGLNGFSIIWSNVSFGPHVLMVEFNGVSSNPVTISVEPEGVALVNENATWKYLDGGADPGTNWFAPNADVSTWASGLPQFGFGEQDERTLVNFRNPTNGLIFPAYYFHHAFVVTNAAGYTNLVARLLRDDGAIVYLNGQELFRENMPAGPVSYTNYASAGAFDENEFTDHWIDPRWLLEGTNHVAVEIHNQAPTSEDISFDLRLIANLPALPPSISVKRSGDVVICTWPRRYLGYRLESAEQLGTGDWQTVTTVVTTPTNFFSTNLITGPARYFRLSL